MWLIVAVLIVLLMVYVPLVSWVSSSIGVAQPRFSRVVLLFSGLLLLQLAHVFLIPGNDMFVLLLITFPASIIATIGLLEFQWRFRLTHLLVPLTTASIMLLTAVLLIDITSKNDPAIQVAAAESKHEQLLNAIAVAAENICICGTNINCIKDESRSFDAVISTHVDPPWHKNELHRLQEYTQRGFDCAYQPGKYEPLLAVANVETQAIPQTNSSEPLAGIETAELKPSADLSFGRSAGNSDTTDDHSIALDDALRYVGQPVRLERKNGAILEGRIVSVKSDRLMFEQQKFGGKISFPVSINEVTNLDRLF